MQDDITSPQFIQGSQYQNSSNLSARIRIHEFYSTNTYNLYRHEFDALLAATGQRGRVLEIGCGRGNLWKENIQRVPDTWDVTLADLSDGMLQDAQTLLGANATRFHWRAADIQALPFDDNSFDAVLAHFMLYHVPDIAKGLQEVKRVLRPGGTLHTATNGMNNMRELELLAADVVPGYESVPWHKSFSLDNGREQLEAVFEDVVLIRRDDALQIPDTRPIVDYLLSGGRIDLTDDTLIADMTRKIQAHIDETGAFHVSKEVGFFISRNPA